jgi:formate hydrogenlyase subunit 3/multisubunit Na+/H+ antiporter MnhD subunit
MKYGIAPSSGGSESWLIVQLVQRYLPYVEIILVSLFILITAYITYKRIKRTMLDKKIEQEKEKWEELPEGIRNRIDEDKREEEKMKWKKGPNA